MQALQKAGRLAQRKRHRKHQADETQREQEDQSHHEIGEDSQASGQFPRYFELNSIFSIRKHFGSLISFFCVVSDSPLCELTEMKNNDKAYIWSCSDFSDEEAKIEMLAARFQTVESNLPRFTLII